MTGIGQSSNSTENIIQFLESGYVEVQSNKFAAHAELETTIQPSTDLITYEANLPVIDFSAFQVCYLAYNCGFPTNK